MTFRHVPVHYCLEPLTMASWQSAHGRPCLNDETACHPKIAIIQPSRRRFIAFSLDSVKGVFASMASSKFCPRVTCMMKFPRFDSEQTTVPKLACPRQKMDGLSVRSYAVLTMICSTDSAVHHGSTRRHGREFYLKYPDELRVPYGKDYCAALGR
jgi:hypothetical protein